MYLLDKGNNFVHCSTYCFAAMTDLGGKTRELITQNSLDPTTW